MPHPRPKRAGERGNLGELQARPAGAEDHGRQRDLQAVERPRCQEPRDGDAAAFDEKPEEPAARERSPDRRRRQPLALARQRNDLRIADPCRGTHAIGCRQHQRLCGPVAEHGAVAGETEVGIEHHAHGLIARAMPDGETRIVLTHGGGADDHGIGECAQAMGVTLVRLARQPLRLATRRRDAAIQTLREMREHEAVAMRHQREGQVEREQLRHLGRRLGLDAPAATARDRQQPAAQRQLQRKAERLFSSAPPERDDRVPGLYRGRCRSLVIAQI